MSNHLECVINEFVGSRFEHTRRLNGALVHETLQQAYTDGDWPLVFETASEFAGQPD